MKKSTLNHTAKKLNEAGLKASVWEKFGKHRVYLDFKKEGKDLSCYFDFKKEDVGFQSEAAPLIGGTFKVYTKADSGSPAWAISRRKEIAHIVASKLFQAGLVKEAPPENFKEMVLN